MIKQEAKTQYEETPYSLNTDALNTWPIGVNVVLKAVGHFGYRAWLMKVGH